MKRIIGDFSYQKIENTFIISEKGKIVAVRENENAANEFMLLKFYEKLDQSNKDSISQLT